METSRNSMILSSLIVFIWILCCVNCQVNCPANADYRQGAGCYCREGYVRNSLGTGCEDLNECATGEHQCQGAAACVNMEATYRCDCGPGFELFQTPRGFQCRDVDECSLNPNSPPCGTNQKCENSPGSYRCTCRDGFTRSHSGRPCTDVDECLVNAWSCHTKANCSNFIGGYNCACQNGYRGDGRTCTDVDECMRLDVCGVNARCTNTDGGFRCECVQIDGSTVDAPEGLNCEEFAMQQGLTSGNGTAHVGIGVGVAMAILALIIAVVIVVIVMRRRTPSKSIPGFSLSDGVEITPIGLEMPHYENVPSHLEDNYITVIADPSDPIHTISGNNFNDLYSNNKIVKAKNIYNVSRSSSMDRHSVTQMEPRVALKPRSYLEPETRAVRKSYEQLSSPCPVVTPGFRPSDHDAHNLIWDKINKDIEAIKPTLRRQSSRVAPVSRSPSRVSNYDHLRDKPDAQSPYGQQYNQLYDQSGQTSF